MSAASHPVVSRFIRELPKAELHLHLEGSVSPETVLELKRRRGLPATMEECRALYRFAGFTGFLMAFKSIAQELNSPEDYELITYELMRRLRAQNILHAEVFVSVGVCLWRKQDFSAIFEGIERGRERGERDFGVSLFWVFDAIRQFGPAAAQTVFELAVHYRDRGVIGVGIGGDEKGGPPELFRENYEYAEDHGLHLTAHAGETAGPDSIWGALNLRAERLGHCLSAGEDEELLEELSQRQVPVEICITSNLKTGVCASVAEHPVRAYFDRGLMLTLNSDDPAIFGSSLNEEYAFAQAEYGFTDEHLRELARNSFEASFLPSERKIHFLNLVDSLPRAARD